MKTMIIIFLISNVAFAGPKKVNLDQLNVDGEKREETRDEEIEWIQKEAYVQNKGLKNYKTKKDLYKDLKNTTNNMLSEFKDYKQEKNDSMKLIEEFNKEYQCSEDKTKCGEGQSAPETAQEVEEFNAEEFARIMNESKPMIVNCYEKLLEIDSSVEMKNASFGGIIHRDGTLSMAEERNRNLHPMMINCLGKVIKTIRVPNVNRDLAFNQPLNFKKVGI